MFLLKSLIVVCFTVLSPVYAGDVALPLTKDTAASLIQQKTKGKILSVDKQRNNGKTVFRVKVLHKDGKVKMFRMDAATGNRLKAKKP